MPPRPSWLPGLQDASNASHRQGARPPRASQMWAGSRWPEGAGWCEPLSCWCSAWGVGAPAQLPGPGLLAPGWGWDGGLKPPVAGSRLGEVKTLLGEKASQPLNCLKPVGVSLLLANCGHAVMQLQLRIRRDGDL